MGHETPASFPAPSIPEIKERFAHQPSPGLIVGSRKSADAFAVPPPWNKPD
jgi:hypothetical protein